MLNALQNKNALNHRLRADTKGDTFIMTITLANKNQI